MTTADQMVSLSEQWTKKADDCERDAQAAKTKSKTRIDFIREDALCQQAACEAWADCYRECAADLTAAKGI
jgi:hypothetical protein